MKDLFLFSNLLNHSHAFVYAFHFCLVALIILIVAYIARSKMQLVPRGLQNIVEAYLEGVISMGKDTLGSEKLARKYLPLVATIGFIVFFSNVIGIIPGFESPSSSFGHFMGPNKFLAPIMFPVEVISHLSRVVSLSFRLFGNIKGDDLFLLAMLTLAPWFAPLPAFALLTLMAVLQTFIFMMLTYVYLAGAVAISEHEH